jgi:hypothetical protein
METGTVFMPLLAALLALTFFKSHVGLPAIVSEYQGHTGNSDVIAGFLFLGTNYSKGNLVSKEGWGPQTYNKLIVNHNKKFYFQRISVFYNMFWQFGHLQVLPCMEYVGGYYQHKVL